MVFHVCTGGLPTGYEIDDNTRAARPPIRTPGCSCATPNRFCSPISGMTDRWWAGAFPAVANTCTSTQTAISNLVCSVTSQRITYGSTRSRTPCAVRCFHPSAASCPPLKNLLRPCIIVDRPYISRQVIADHNAYFTHKGAEIVYQDLKNEIDAYAAEYGDIADELWEKYFCRKN